MQISSAEWLAEIEIVKTQILRWLQQQHPADPLLEAIRKVSVPDAMMLGVDSQIWLYMVLGITGEIYEFEPELEDSDIWQCAIESALSDFRNAPV